MGFELPEAAIVAGQMNQVMRGRTLQNAQLNDSDWLIRNGYINRTPDQWQRELNGLIVDYVTAKGRWIFVHFDVDVFLLLALLSRGKVRYYPPGTEAEHPFHVLLEMDDGSSLYVHFVGWGYAKIVPQDELSNHVKPGRQGLNPLDSQRFTLENFKRYMNAFSQREVKVVLANQAIISGLGNFYLQDILYRARIHPARKVSSLSDEEYQRLYASINDTMLRAIGEGGSAEEVDIYGSAGGYHAMMGVHALGKPCYVCSQPIERVRVGGTSSYFCPQCQK